MGFRVGDNRGSANLVDTNLFNLEWGGLIKDCISSRYKLLFHFKILFNGKIMHISIIYL